MLMFQLFLKTNSTSNLTTAPTLQSVVSPFQTEATASLSLSLLHMLHSIWTYVRIRGGVVRPPVPKESFVLIWLVDNCHDSEVADVVPAPGDVPRGRILCCPSYQNE